MMRFTTRLFATLVSAVVLGLLSAGAAAAATPPDSTYPAPEGSTFTGDVQGWRDAGASCNLLGIEGILCSARNEHDGTGGNPGGALTTRFNALVNAVGLFIGQGAWLSPAFTVEPPPGDATIQGGTLHFDRRAAIQALIDVGGTALYKVQLIDVTDPAQPRTEVANGTLTQSDQAWRGVEVALSRAQVVAGRDYRLAFVTRMTSQTAQLLAGEIAMSWDNVRLTVHSAATATGDEIGGADDPSRKARRLLRVDTSQARIKRRGQFRNELRIRIFCKPTSLRRCEGAVKVRSRSKVNPSISSRSAKRRVTLGSEEYVCPRRMVCYVKVQLRDRTRRWTAARSASRGLAADALVTVLDEDGVQQTLTRGMRVRASR